MESSDAKLFQAIPAKPRLNREGLRANGRSSSDLAKSSNPINRHQIAFGSDSHGKNRRPQTRRSAHACSSAWVATGIKRPPATRYDTPCQRTRLHTRLFNHRTKAIASQKGTSHHRRLSRLVAQSPNAHRRTRRPYAGASRQPHSSPPEGAWGQESQPERSTASLE